MFLSSGVLWALWVPSRSLRTLALTFQGFRIQGFCLGFRGLGFRLQNHETDRTLTTQPTAAESTLNAGGLGLRV